MKVCQNCGHENSDTGKFCEECGVKLVEAPKFCPECGAKLEGTPKFCTECGTAVGAGSRASAPAKPNPANRTGNYKDSEFMREVKALIESGADLDATDDDDMTALMVAAINNASDVANALIEAGADVNAKDRYGRTAFMLTVKKDIEKVLKEAGARWR